MKTDLLRERSVLVYSLVLLMGLSPLFGACTQPEVSHNNAGNERFAKGAYDQALEEYRLAQLADPDLAVPYYNAANSRNRRSQLGAVVALTAQALKTAGPELAANVWYNLANAFFDAEKWPEAITAYQEALRIRTDDRDAKHNLELALRKLEEQQSNDTTRQEQKNAHDEANPSEKGEPTPSPSDHQDQSASQEQLTPEPEEEPQIKDRMSRGQAEQLLEALVGNGETLQERLQKTHPAPGTQPDKDW